MAQYSIGVDLGGTNLRIAAYTEADSILDSILLPTRLAAGRDAVLEDMCQAIETLEARFSSAHTLVGVGVGTPGPLELPTGRLHNLPNFPGWDGFELKARLDARLRRDVIVESDANLAALAEVRLGLGKSLGLDSLCMLTLGTGVGNGIILNGRVWDGAHGMAGEAGHATIYVDGPACTCGSNGCLELYASATAVVRIAYERIADGSAPELVQSEGAPRWTARSLAHAADAGNADAARIFADAGRALGIGLAALVNTLNLPLYTLGGGLVQAWHLMEGALFEELNRRSYVYRLTAPGSKIAAGHPRGATRVLPAELGPDAGLLGACILPFLELEAN
ncbi:ROK family protein [Silvibacterium dinghuense]|uniref:ROK family protein n=1 Tax=Silvibacterium dinghuense TaxID=1560006 RepID=A0A4Q1SDA3_9BACT|nr:ROK family protein [Silvibacterium dinghuense]RXS95057.1 ROK family protein [Silvibacterium dinghuense]GGH10229.1 sugar kinase [Silvibacterium dinghuense]